jgi:hypothetical protein
MDLLERELLAVSPEEAVHILEQAGLRSEVQFTGPPRHPEAGGRERVVRLRVRGSTGIVTVARELDYMPV